ncbi:hypothetical protein BDV96DRAFT_574920 [Lophiotrema nucula]|uniref:Chromosome segregation in meiosis protein 3 domain-containing protein n=1 Tax=Lophiotrema nucula TaxID=690887 RepID=A0A6A5Z968_9PLEO|nr:hypothetical protein BDV96DRAFT_574920 [Lophiotrema nucula]
MLNMYQLWLDELYPRAKFADGLTMIEKLGHSKRMGYMRKEWIDEGKPKTSVEDDPEETEATQPEAHNAESEQMEGVVRHSTEEEPKQPGRGESPCQRAASPTASRGVDPDEDELDALLAETAAPNSALTSAMSAPRIASVEEDMFAEEMEAMAEMEGMW